MYPAYIYQTSNPKIAIVVPTDASVDAYAADMPNFLSASDFNLTNPASSKTMREARAAASEQGVKLRNVKTCARVADHSRIAAVEP